MPRSPARKPPWFLVFTGIGALAGGVAAMLLGREAADVVVLCTVGLTLLLVAYLGPRLEGPLSVMLGGGAGVVLNIVELSRLTAKADQDLKEGNVTTLESLEAESDAS